MACGQDAVVRAFRSPEEEAAACTDGSCCGRPLPDPSAPMASTSEAEGHCSVVHALALCSGYVCSAGGDAMIRVWRQESLDFVR